MKDVMTEQIRRFTKIRDDLQDLYDTREHMGEEYWYQRFCHVVLNAKIAVPPAVESSVTRIFIDDVLYDLPDDRMSGDELRRFANVRDNLHLWQIHERGEDVCVEGQHLIILEPADRFFTSPKRINGG